MFRVWGVAGTIAFAARGENVSSGQMPPAEIQQRAKPAMDALAAALAVKDETRIRAACSNAIAALGLWAGNPQNETHYYPPPDKRPFDVAKVRAYWLDQIAQGRRKFVWVKNPSGDPKKMEAGLRAAAVPLEAIARTIPVAREREAELLPVVRAGADWLLARQHSSGVFPMPVGPAINPRDKVGHILERMLKEHPELNVNGWVVDVPNDGGLQFDNGLCGRAMIEAWAVTHETNYLASAKRAADWAMKQPLCPNWNYNAFSVGLLARVAKVTGEGTYLDAAVEKARVGVLPGQLPSGRWLDPHNASAVYHNILMRDLLLLHAALPGDHAFKPVVRDAIFRGVDQAANETINNGYCGTWTEIFAEAINQFGNDHRAWGDALNINVNASLGGKGPGLGVSAAYLINRLP